MINQCCYALCRLKTTFVGVFGFLIALLATDLPVSAASINTDVPADAVMITGGLSITIKLILYFVILLGIGLSVLIIISHWKLFKKAGEPGWVVFVPLYNIYVLYKIAFGHGWLFLLMFIPYVNYIAGCFLCFKLAKAYGHNIGYGFGLLFLYPIFIIIMGFDKHEYIGPDSLRF